MDKFIAVIILIAVAAFLIFGELYFMIEKSRTLLSMLMIKLKPGICEWLTTASALCTRCGGDYPALFKKHVDVFLNVPEKQLYRYTGEINQVYRLICKALADNIEDPPASALGRKLTEQSHYLVFPLDDFNKEASRLNERLSRPLSSLVGKAFKIEAVPVICDLSML